MIEAVLTAENYTVHTAIYGDVTLDYNSFIVSKGNEVRELLNSSSVNACRMAGSYTENK